MASSSTSSGGMSNMSRLMASSRFSSYHPKIPQVYTAPPSYIARGDFGVKRPLPTQNIPIGKVRYVDFADIDTEYRQTDWREREREVLMLKRFKELNVKLTSPHGKNAPKGTLGPKLSTKYDYSTKRMVPTDYDMVPDEEIKKYLQAQARLGTAPVYPHNMSDNASLSAISGYSDQPEIRYNYRTMSEKRFQKYLEEVRSKREDFKDFLANRAANLARARVAQQYNSNRERLEEKAGQTEIVGTSTDVVPEVVEVSSLPLLKRSEDDSDTGIQIDLWDEARLVDAEKKPWEPWLKSQNTSPIREADSQLLPLQFNTIGGHEVPTPLHPHGGLQYSQPDSISTQLLYGSLPARVLGSAREAESKSLNRTANARALMRDRSVAIAGRIATMQHNLSANSRPIDVSGNESRQGNIRVKIVSATRVIETIPEQSTSQRFTNAHDSGLPPQYGNTVLTVRASESADESSMAKGIPGSTEWIARRDGTVRSSGQGQRGVYDIADIEGIASNRRALDIDSDRRRYDYARATPQERQRKSRRDQLQTSSSASQREMNALWDNLPSSTSIRRDRKSKATPYRPRPPPPSSLASGDQPARESDGDAAKRE